MERDVCIEILSLDRERYDLALRIVRTAGWVRVADDEDGTPLYASEPNAPGLPLSLAVALIVTAARVERRAQQADEKPAGQQGEAGAVHGATVAPSTRPGESAR